MCRFVSGSEVQTQSGLGEITWRGFVYPKLFRYHMELLFAIPVVLGACLLGSFLGKTFVALIQKFSGD